MWLLAQASSCGLLDLRAGQGESQQLRASGFNLGQIRYIGGKGVASAEGRAATEVS